MTSSRNFRVSDAVSPEVDCQADLQRPQVDPRACPTTVLPSASESRAETMT